MHEEMQKKKFILFFYRFQMTVQLSQMGRSCVGKGRAGWSVISEVAILSAETREDSEDSECSEDLAEGSESLAKGSKGLAEGSEGLEKGSEYLEKGSKDHAQGSKGQTASSKRLG